MFPSRAFADRYFAPRYFAKVGAGTGVAAPTYRKLVTITVVTRMTQVCSWLAALGLGGTR